MQFHLDGFRTGNPAIAPRSERARKRNGGDELPKKVDILIIGCGPAGLTLAAQLAAFPNITTCIVDQKSGPMERGQADGIACRSMEMFHAFGFAEDILRESYWVNEATFWQPDALAPNNIVRSGRVQDVEDGLSEFPHVILNQARVHDYFLDVMRRSPSRLEPDYSRELLSLDILNGEIDEEVGYRVSATIQRNVDDGDKRIEHIKARYVVGCDGARSTVRRSMNLKLKGDSANHAWGVMDVLAVTDFPDIRMKSLIRSDSNGSILIIPREGGYLVRLYVEMGKLNEDERVSSREITAEKLIRKASAILQPYTLDVKEVAWWSVYEIGQRLCDKFDNVDSNNTLDENPCVFIAGDACHTHSPKAGQGMNVSMRDTFNLGWKLISVLQNRCSPSLLHTYSEERHKVAKTLIDFDKEWSSIIASAAQSDHAAATDDKKKLQEYFVKSGRYTAGTAIQYQPSLITGKAVYQQLAKGFEIGKRFHSASVIRLADAKTVHLGHVVKADARWRLFAFADESNTASSSSLLRSLCEYLYDDPDSPLVRFASDNEDIDSIIDVRAILQQGFRDTDINHMPPLLRPQKGALNLVDYEKVYCRDEKTDSDIFQLRGINCKRGCLIIVRPDQHVAHVLPLDALNELNAFFNGFMLER